jgi:hypothetical protein
MVVPHQFHFSADALVKSIAHGVWTESYHYFWAWLLLAKPRLMAVVFVFLTLALLVLFRLLRAGDYVRPTTRRLSFALLIGAGVAAPTVVLEAMSDTWTPGTRWPMLLQFWSPFVFCVIVFIAMSVLPDHFWSGVWRAVNASAAAFAIVLALGFNHTQVLHVEQERAFFTQLRSVVAQDRVSGAKFPRRYLIETAEPAPFIPLPGRLANAYAHTLLGRDVTFEVVKAPPAPSADSLLLIWKDQRLSAPFATMSGEAPALPPVRP